MSLDSSWPSPAPNNNINSSSTPHQDRSSTSSVSLPIIISPSTRPGLGQVLHRVVSAISPASRASLRIQLPGLLLFVISICAPCPLFPACVCMKQPPPHSPRQPGSPYRRIHPIPYTLHRHGPPTSSPPPPPVAAGSQASSRLSPKEKASEPTPHSHINSHSKNPLLTHS